MTVTIRDAIPADAAVIADYNARIAGETEGKALDMDLLRPGVEALLADATKGRYWVAEAEGDVVGQIMTTFEWSDWRNGMIWWLQSVYVRADQRRTGVFSMLYRHVQSLARTAPDVIGIRLCVEKDNAAAQSTYKRLGLAMTEYRVMETIWTDRTDRKGG